MVGVGLAAACHSFQSLVSHVFGIGVKEMDVLSGVNADSRIMDGLRLVRTRD